MRQEAAENNEDRVAVLTCGPGRMVKEVFLNAQKFSKPFTKKNRRIENDKRVSDAAKSLIKGKEFEIKIIDKKKIKNKKQVVNFDYHSEIFNF